MEEINAWLTFAQVVMLALVPAYLTYLSKRRESEATEKVAKTQNEDDLLTAVSSLQADYALKYRQLMDDVTIPMEKLRAETEMLRSDLKESNRLISSLRGEVSELRHQDELKTKRISDLETALSKERDMRRSLQAKLNKIKNEISTGPLASGVHKIPTEDDKDGN